MDYSWKCGCCGKMFDTLPMDFFSSGPTNWMALSEAEKLTRSKKDSNLCVIDDTEMYVRGCIELPVLDSSENFRWGVWVSVSKESFQRILDLWEAVDLENEPPRFGWLCNWIEGYPEPIRIKCHVRLRPKGLRPLIELEPTDYPLAIEQRDGITLDRVKEIAASSGHGRPD